MDGYEVTRRLRGTPHSPIFHHPGDDAGRHGQPGARLEAGANDFLAKPPDQAELLARVRTLVRLKVSHQDLVAEKSRTELLYHVGRELSAELDLDTLLSRILELTIGAVQSSRGSIILLDEQGKAFRNIFCHEGQITTVTDTVQGAIVEQGLAGWAIATAGASSSPIRRRTRAGSPSSRPMSPHGRCLPSRWGRSGSPACSP